MSYKKKLIEVALPLPEINDASAYDKMPGIGPHPKGIHHWWARLPLPTARAVLFASVVDDPSEHPELYRTEAAQTAERERLFGIVRKLMQKRLHEQPQVYAEAHAEMLRNSDRDLPHFLDPFAGGGSIPLEASRFGLQSLAADLNPVAVLLNKCNLELVPRWLGRAAVNPAAQRAAIGGTGAHGLSEDIRYFGKLVHERAKTALQHLYPAVQLPREYGGRQTSVIAWIWVRTVASPNPAAGGKHVPLASTYLLSAKANNLAWIEPVLDGAAQDGWRAKVRTGRLTKEQLEKIKLGSKAGKAQDFICLLTNTPIDRAYVQAEGKAGRLRERLMAIVADGGSAGKVFVSPDEGHEATATVRDDRIDEARSSFLAGSLPTRAEITGGVCTAYGLRTWGHLFTARQLLSLLTFSGLVRDVHSDVQTSARKSGMSASEAGSYATTVTTFLALNLDRCADLNNSLCTWNASDQVLRNLFKRQALPMVWDFAEANILEEVVGGWPTCIDRTAKCVITMSGSVGGSAANVDAATTPPTESKLLISTDPPYYDNISYATLSDFFYVWLRQMLGKQFPDLFQTVFTPKTPELIASPDRFDGSRTKAKEHFEEGFRRAFTHLRERMDPRFPLSVYYAFKQSDEEEETVDANSAARVDLTTGWETLLEALVGSGFQVTATWPVRASQKWRMTSMGTNALASYIVLACRPRPSDALQTGRREFLGELRRELPSALRHLQQGNIAPVDFAQASIGPGMAVYSRHREVLEADGRRMSVRAALGLINQVKDEVLGEAESDFEPYTRWAIAWYDQHGFAAGPFGDANTLATAHAVSVGGLKEAGLVASGEGDVRLLKPEEMTTQSKAGSKMQLTVWQIAHQLIRLYCVENAGDMAAAELLKGTGAKADLARELAYRLFTIAERRKRTQEAKNYNMIVTQWSDLAKLTQMPTTAEQPSLI